MRSLLVIVWLALPMVALAKPKLAVAPIKGDTGGKVADAIAEVVAGDATLISAKKVERAARDLDLDREVDMIGAKKLAAKVDADVVVHGKIEKDDGKKTAALAVTRRGKKSEKFEVTFKSATSDKFKRELREEIAKRLGGGDDDDSDARAKAKEREREKDEREARAKEREREKDRERDDDDKKRRKRIAERDDDDDGGSVKKKKSKKKRRGGDDDDDRDDDDNDDDLPARHPTTQAAVRVHAGGAFGRRSLTYATTATTNVPPPVGTAAAAGRFDAELYPASFSSLKGPAAALGFVAEYEKVFGLAIDIPAGSAPMNQTRLAVGGRYRFTFGTHSVAAGLSYWKRSAIADRSGLPMPTALDMPDVSYTAVAPALVARIGAAPNLGLFASLEVPLVLDAGGIQKNDSYGPADVVAFELEAGADYTLGQHVALRFLAELSQVGLTFSQRAGTMSAARSVTAATDRIIGGSVTLLLMY